MVRRIGYVCLKSLTILLRVGQLRAAARRPGLYAIFM